MILERALVSIASQVLQAGKNQRLTREGHRSLTTLGMDLVRGNHFEISEKIGVLEGFEVKAEGFEKLRKEAQKAPFLICANHFVSNPGKIVGNLVALSYSIKKELDIEPYAVFGNGFSPVSAFRERAERATNIILVGGKEKGFLVISRALNEGKSLIFYPEGTNSETLMKANFKAGRVILGAARKGISTATVGLCFDPHSRTFNVTGGEIISPEEIIEEGCREGGKTLEEIQRSGQAVVDNVMHSIALLLPEKYRGYYSR